jgi:hypothetical protein
MVHMKRSRLRKAFGVIARNRLDKESVTSIYDNKGNFTGTSEIHHIAGDRYHGAYHHPSGDVVFHGEMKDGKFRIAYWGSNAIDMSGQALHELEESLRR